MDLVSINLQRGRDHGLPGYNKFRALCGLRRAETFSELSDVMTEDQISHLSSLYSHVDDIDLYLAGLMESPLSGSLLGPTFSCIISDQMYRARAADRFFYSLTDSASQLSEGKCGESSRASLSDDTFRPVERDRGSQSGQDTLR